MLKLLEEIHALIDSQVASCNKVELGLKDMVWGKPDRNNVLLIMDPEYTGNSFRASGRINCNTHDEG